MLLKQGFWASAHIAISLSHGADKENTQET